jgi:hypothetical protein
MGGDWHSNEGSKIAKINPSFVVILQNRYYTVLIKCISYQKILIENIKSFKHFLLNKTKPQLCLHLIKLKPKTFSY